MQIAAALILTLASSVAPAFRWSVAVALLLLAGVALGHESEVFERVFQDAGQHEIGHVSIMNDPDGPDAARFEFYGLLRNEGFTLHLAHSAATGSVPTVFVAQFRSDENGAATLMLMTEIIDAYVTANSGVENIDGVAVTGIDTQFPPGMVNNGGTTIPMSYFRVHQAKSDPIQGVRSVFGTNERITGGVHYASTVHPF